LAVESAFLESASVAASVAAPVATLLAAAVTAPVAVPIIAPMAAPVASHAFAHRAAAASTVKVARPGTGTFTAGLLSGAGGSAAVRASPLSRPATSGAVADPPKLQAASRLGTPGRAPRPLAATESTTSFDDGRTFSSVGDPHSQTESQAASHPLRGLKRALARFARGFKNAVVIGLIPSLLVLAFT
jgi:hypothetical protein